MKTVIILEPFERFVVWRQCAAVMQSEAVTVKVLVVGVT
jgi:hypothetical protein